MSIPKWRYVRHTDDGSDLYQCLNCYNSWDTRNAPGYYTTTRSVDHPVPNCRSYRATENGKQVTRYYEELATPEYVKCQSFCPYCGVQWEEPGAVRCDQDNEFGQDNEFMYGLKRARVFKMIQERRRAEGWRQPEYTRLWWVIVERSVWRSDTAQSGNVGDWAPQNYARVDLMPAAKMLYLLKDHQERLDLEHNNDPHSFCDYEAKIVVTFVQPKSGYEIRNYDWERNEPEYTKPKADRPSSSSRV